MEKDIRLRERLRYLFMSFEGQFLGLICLMLFSIVYSQEFITSQAMFFISGVVLFQRKENGRGLQLRKGNRARLKEQGIWSPYWWLGISFVLVLISMFWSDNMKYSMRWVQLKIPFVVFPLVFVMAKGFSQKFLYNVLYFLLLLMTVSIIPVLINYLQDMEQINLLLSQGQPVPVPSNHIRYSMMLSLACISGVILLYNKHYVLNKKERYLQLACSLFLFFMIHLLSVRTGIALVYLFIALFLVFALFKFKRKAYVLGVFAVMLITPFIAYKTLPSLKNKINYVLWDMGKFREGREQHYSDSERIISIKAGCSLFEGSPLLGVGAGDVKDELKAYYGVNYPALKVKLPHSQFVTVLASYGILGLILFLIGLLLPMWYYRKNILFLSFSLFMLASMFFESTLETNYGISIYLIFSLLGMKVIDEQKAS